MKIVSFIEPTQPDVIDAILTHCGLADEPPRTPPNAPPPGFHELQYVNELEFVHDPGPAETVWSADRSTPLISQTPRRRPTRSVREFLATRTVAVDFEHRIGRRTRCDAVRRAPTPDCTLVRTPHDATAGAGTPTPRHHDRSPRIKCPISGPEIEQIVADDVIGGGVFDQLRAGPCEIAKHAEKFLLHRGQIVPPAPRCSDRSPRRSRRSP